MKRKHLISSLLCSMFLFAGQQASATTYFLNQSTEFADGINYAQVDVDANSAGNLDFTVTALEPSGYRFSDFYFNLSGDTGTVTLTNLPTGWIADTDQVISAFGEFTDGLRKSAGGTLQSILTFTADGVNDLSLANLVTNEVGFMFASHLQCNTRDNTCSSVDGATSGHIAGPDISPVPIPGAIWLFGSALMGFVSMNSRKKV